MPLTQEQYAQGLQDIRNQFNDNPDIDIKEARKIIAEEEAQLLSDFIIGRKTDVEGTSATGGVVTGTGTILE